MTYILTKNDLKNILKIYRKFDNKNLNEIIKNPDIIKDNELKLSLKKFIKLENNHLNKIKYYYDKYISLKRGSGQMELTDDKINNYFDIIKYYSNNIYHYFDNDISSNYNYQSFIDIDLKPINNIKLINKIENKFINLDYKTNECTYLCNNKEKNNSKKTEIDMDNFFEKNKILEVLNIIKFILDDLFNIGNFNNIDNLQIINLFNKLGLLRFHNSNFYLKQFIFTNSSDSLLVALGLINNLPEDNIIFVNLLKQQNDEIDINYISNPNEFVNNIKNKINNNIRCNFQDLFLLEHYMKRLIQNTFTDFLNNYVVEYDNGKFNVYESNLIYIDFLINTINSLKEYLENSENLYYSIEEYYESDSGKNIIYLINEIDSKIDKAQVINKTKNDIKIIMKGGNVIKLYMENFNINNSEFSLNDYTEYFKNLSDFDFDVKLNNINPFNRIYREDDLKQSLNNNKIILLTEFASRKIVFSLILKYFNEFFIIPENIKNNINCHINYFNYLFNYEILEKILQNNYKYYNIDIENILNKDIHNYSYFTNNLRYDIQTETNPSELLSLTSSFNLGYFNNINNNRFLNSFDLTRLQLRLKINIPFNNNYSLPIITKAEVFDFGYSHLFSTMNIHLPSGNENTFILNLDLNNNNLYEIKIKDMKFILNELLHICIYSNDSKSEKRFFRLFKILEKIFEKYSQENVNDVINNECLSLKLLNNNLDFNFVDGIMYIIKNIHQNNNIEKEKLNEIPIFNELSEKFLNLNDDGKLELSQLYLSNNTKRVILSL